MILAMMIGYLVVLHLIFNVFKIVQPSTRNKIYVAVLGCFLIYCVLLVINWYQPMSTDMRVFRAVVPIRSRVTGIVSEVPVAPNVPINEGDVIFRIDPRPFEADVARLKAALAEAEQQAKTLPVELAAAQAAVAKADAALVEANQNTETLEVNLNAAEAGVRKFQAQLELAQTEFDRQGRLLKDNATSQADFDKARRNLAAATATLEEAQANRDATKLAYDSKIGDVNTIIVRAQQALLEAQASENKAKLALESTIDGENTTVARIRAELAAAEVDFADTVVRAPADGHVTNLAVRPGQFIANNTLGVATFVSAEGYGIAATFRQEVINTIEPGDAAELAFDDLPGRTFSATVKNINMGIPQGQVIAKGELLDTTPVPHGRFLVQFTLDDDGGLNLPAGAAGAATIYTDGGRIFVPVRKVFFRWYTWLNYIMTDMDVRGQRQ